MKRIGRFTLSRDVIEGNPNIAMKFFSDLIIIKATSDYVSNSIEYTAIGDMFPEVPEGGMIPIITPLIMKVNDYSYIVWE